MIHQSDLSSGDTVNRRTRDTIDGYLFASPWIIGFVAFTLGPMLFAIFLSLAKWDAQTSLANVEFIGLQHYKTIFTNDRMFWTSLYNTAFYTIFAVPLRIFGALILAMILNQQIRGVSIFRTLFYLPSVVSGAATAILWWWVFNPYFGALNSLLTPILSFFGAQPPGWLEDPNWSKPALILMTAWGLGAPMLIFLAGLQGVPRHLYEAAELDGAGRLRKFWNVTIPMITPTILFNLVMAIIGSFQVFMMAFIMSEGNRGGPDDSTLFYVLYLYRKAFIDFEMGYASALAWILFVIILFFTLLVLRSSAVWVYYEGERKK